MVRLPLKSLPKPLWLLTSVGNRNMNMDSSRNDLKAGSAVGSTWHRRPWLLVPDWIGVSFSFYKAGGCRLMKYYISDACCRCVLGCPGSASRKCFHSHSYLNTQTFCLRNHIFPKSKETVIFFFFLSEALYLIKNMLRATIISR